MSTLEYYLQNPNFSHLSRTPFYDNDLGLDCNMSIAESDNYCRLPEREVKRLFEASCVESKEGPFVSDNTLLKALEHVDITSNKDPPSCNFANNDFNYDNYNKAMFAFPSYSNKTDTSQGLLNPSPFGPISSSMPDHYFSPPSFLPYHHDQACDKAKKRSPTITKKERRRTHSINSAFSALRNCIPNVPSDTKLSKIKTLRLATSYIAFLMNVIDKNDPKLAEMGFKADMSSSRRNENREEKRRREAQEILKASMKQADKQPKGRTGWPQQVWAAELK